MKSLTRPLVVTAITIAMGAHESVAFVTPSQSKAKVTSRISMPSLIHQSTPTTGRYQTCPTFKDHQQKTSTTTSLRMSYQLPPSPPEPKGPLDQIKDILPTITTAILVVAFFASPLGGIFFAVTNSLFVLALLTPFILFGGFQIWTSLYTVEAPCPSCEAIPVRVLKTGEPSSCLNCGSYVRANEKGDGLELCNNPNSMMGGGGSMFDALFGGGGGDMGNAGGNAGGNGFSDIFADVVGDAPKKEEQASKAKRQGTIIDVDVERD